MPDFFLVTIWFGLLVGLGEVFLRGIQRFLFHEFIHQSRDVVWMAPLADTALFVVAGLLLLFGARWWPRLTSLQAATFIFAFLGFLGPLLWYPRLHSYAGALLALGLAAQTSRFVKKHSQGFMVFVHRTLALMIVLTAGLAVWALGWPGLVERHALAKLPSPPAKSPNVLLIVLDTVRAQSLSLYGYERPTTPFLGSLAKKGVVFEEAISTSPWTLSAHASMFTGRFPHELSADWLTPLDGTYPTLPEVFRARGYLTGGFAANLYYCTYEHGLDRGFLHYEDYPVSLRVIIRSSWLARTIFGKSFLKVGTGGWNLERNAESVNRAFFRWLSQKGERPFFVFLNYIDAHSPYLPPPPFDLKFASRKPQSPHAWNTKKYSPDEIRDLRNAYDGTIAYLDHQVGLLLSELDKRDLQKDTLIMITSDHGEQFAEHGLVQHGNSLYRPLLHVPLLVSYPPHIPSSKRVKAPVSLADIPATVMDIVGWESESHFPGESLARYWRRERSFPETRRPLLSEVSKAVRQPEHLPASQGSMKSLLDGRWHFIVHEKLGIELYDWENDPGESHNLAGRPDLQPLVARLRSRLPSFK